MKANPPSRGLLVVVGGHSRGVGKTSLITWLLPHLKPSPWVAIKISRHRHGNGAGFSISEECQTSSRFLSAGASRAYLLRAADEEMADASAWVNAQLEAGNCVVAESNRLPRFLRPDLLLFVIRPEIADWKDSSAECIASADALIFTAPLNAAPAVKPVACVQIHHYPNRRVFKAGIHEVLHL